MSVEHAHDWTGATPEVVRIPVTRHRDTVRRTGCFPSHSASVTLSRMRRTLTQLRVFLETNPYTAGATARLSRRARLAVFLYRLSLRILAQWARDKCPQQAAALAFQTALSLVPVTAIAFSILRAVGSLDAESRLSQFVAEHVFPNMADVTARISEFSGKVSIGALGGGGLLFTLVTCYSLYSYVERIFNDVWRVGERRTLIGKFLTFYAMVTLLPTLAGFSLYWSGRLIESRRRSPLHRAAAHRDASR